MKGSINHTSTWGIALVVIVLHEPFGAIRPVARPGGRHRRYGCLFVWAFPRDRPDMSRAVQGCAGEFRSLVAGSGMGLGPTSVIFMFAEHALLPVGTEGNHLVIILSTGLHTGAALDHAGH